MWRGRHLTNGDAKSTFKVALQKSGDLRANVTVHDRRHVQNGNLLRSERKVTSNLESHHPTTEVEVSLETHRNDLGGVRLGNELDVHVRHLGGIVLTIQEQLRIGVVLAPVNGNQTLLGKHEVELGTLAARSIEGIAVLLQSRLQSLVVAKHGEQKVEALLHLGVAVDVETQTTLGVNQLEGDVRLGKGQHRVPHGRVHEEANAVGVDLEGAPLDSLLVVEDLDGEDVFLQSVTGTSLHGGLDEAGEAQRELPAAQLGGVYAVELHGELVVASAGNADLVARLVDGDGGVVVVERGDGSLVGVVEELQAAGHDDADLLTAFLGLLVLLEAVELEVAHEIAHGVNGGEAEDVDAGRPRGDGDLARRLVDAVGAIGDLEHHIFVLVPVQIQVVTNELVDLGGLGVGRGRFGGFPGRFASTDVGGRSVAVGTDGGV
ncbi:type I restriction endonuclease subunit R [Babesia caballi]|uniref:Type I restriction endonuclease subunit R n=1 Tax=Babesia caballi TaxID=5871 RepID=A0AAV4LQE3_BABCB|nr:type I restriction endonuclease subunit R [Babesia caballi]